MVVSRKIDVVVDEVRILGDVVRSVHFRGPVGWKARFAINSDRGWVSGSDVAPALSCFRSTPGASLSPSVAAVDNIKSLLAAAVVNAPAADIVRDKGWGVAVRPHAFSWARMDDAVIGFDESSVPVYGRGPVDGFRTLTETAMTAPWAVMGDLRPKSRPARAKFENRLRTIWSVGEDLTPSVGDALTNYPLRYKNLTGDGSGFMSAPDGVEDVAVIELTTTSLMMTAAGVDMLLIKGRTVGSGLPFECAVFGSQETKTTLRSIRFCDEGDALIVFGRVQTYNGAKSLKSPWVFPLDLHGERLLPVYRGSTKQKVTPTAARMMTSAVTSAYASRIEDVIPDHILSARSLCSRSTALSSIHNPRNWGEVTTARKRLAYDDFLRILAYVREGRERTDTRTTPSTAKAEAAAASFVRGLPFPLTKGQKETIRAIVDDFGSGTRMRRLVEGDVGTGKTVCALAAAVAIIADGRQVAVLAPTSVLARQLYSEFADVEGVNAALLVGGITTKKNRRVVEGVRDGDVDVVVGTHTILSGDMSFHDLGLVIVDEQHKFGVEQRRRLLTSSPGAHFLMMSATPIPSSIASIVYGDLDVSVIRDLPAGRIPIVTEYVQESSDAVVADPHHPLWDEVRQEMLSGHRVYVIASLVEANDDRASTESTATALRKIFGDAVAVVHGKMKAGDKDAALAAFADGTTPILVSSSVVEVGVNVPDATLEIVLDAPRFGLASLHQLRGRVGRSNLPSKCVLLGRPSSTDPEKSLERMKTMTTSTSGFDIATADLELRGEGEFFGTSQSGRSDLGIASITKDATVLSWAKEDIKKMEDEVVTVLAEEMEALHPQATL